MSWIQSGDFRRGHVPPWNMIIESFNQIIQASPFNGLIDFQLQMEFENCKQRIDSILDAKGWNYYIENLNLRDLRCKSI